VRQLLVLVAACAAALLAAAPKLAPVDETSYAKLLADHRGKVVMVDFWATYCVPCRAEMPQLVAMHAKLRDKGLQLITVSADEPEKQAEAEKFLAQRGATAPAYIKNAKDDDKFINLVDPKWSGALPALFLYDRTGRKVKMFVGETPMKELEAAVSKLLASPR